MNKLQERKDTIDRLRAKLREFEEELNLQLAKLRQTCPHIEMISVEDHKKCTLCGKKI